MKINNFLLFLIIAFFVYHMMNRCDILYEGMGPGHGIADEIWKSLKYPFTGK